MSFGRMVFDEKTWKQNLAKQKQSFASIIQFFKVPFEDKKVIDVRDKNFGDHLGKITS